jgi:hypothetical protein
MALTNIELYEALKRDLNEDAARMIAEVVPPASDLATRGYIDERLRETERRVFRYALVFVGPVWVAMIAGLVKLVLKF